MPADIILLAAIAAFILLRLRGVLGQKIGHDQPPSMPKVVKKEERVIHLKPAEPAIKDVTPVVAEIAPEQVGVYSEAVENGAAEIRKLDASFRMKEFLEGAKVAFDMVHEAFRKDDRDTLKFLLSKDISKAFMGELDKQKQEKDHAESTLVAILSALPIAVEMEKNKGRVTVAFVTEQIHIRRDEAGKVVEGSPSDIQRVEDEWVFERDLRSTNPNWVVVAT